MSGKPVERKKRNPWTNEEDNLLRNLVQTQGNRLLKEWEDLARRHPTRDGKQCRDRWINHLSDEINKGPITKEESDRIFELQRRLGNKWAEIARILRRTPLQVKNHYYADKREKERKKSKLEREKKKAARAAKAAATRKKKAPKKRKGKRIRKRRSGQETTVKKGAQSILTRKMHQKNESGPRVPERRSKRLSEKNVPSIVKTNKLLASEIGQPLVKGDRILDENEMHTPLRRRRRSSKSDKGAKNVENDMRKRKRVASGNNLAEESNQERSRNDIRRNGSQNAIIPVNNPNGPPSSIEQRRRQYRPPLKKRKQTKTRQIQNEIQKLMIPPDGDDP